MVDAPHPHSLVPSEDVEMILDHFKDEVRLSWMTRKFDIDTSDLSPKQLLETFLEQSVPYLNACDGNTRILNGRKK
jgi:hypothetical protein